MQVFVNYWPLIVVVLALLVICNSVIYRFSKMDTEEQIKNIKEWLKYAVIIAEKEFGSKTGQLKLRYVYNLFIEKFPDMKDIVSFEEFRVWVDGALLWMNKQLETNRNIKAIILK